MKQKHRVLLAGMMGNLIETFDLGICGLLSIFLANYFMVDVTKGLWIVWTTFIAGYVVRPLGAITLGLFSDRYGRKRILAGSILSMGVSTSLIAFVPPYASIGILAPIFLLILRLVQSFSCGAEYLNTSVYLIENTENSRKGYAGSWAAFGAIAGLLLASLSTWGVILLTAVYPKYEWVIWRGPFVLALLGSSIGLYIRLLAPENRNYSLHASEGLSITIKTIFNESWRYLRLNPLLAFYAFTLCLLGITLTFQVYVYAPTQARLSSSFTSNQMIISTVLSLTILLSVCPIIGKISDRIDREKIMMAANLGLVILFPLFFYSLLHNDYSNLLLTHALIAIPIAAYQATIPAVLAEIFPIKLRCTVLSAIYAIAATVAAGLIPLLSFLLLNKTQISIPPSVIVIVLSSLLMLGIKLKRVKSDLPGSE